MVILSYKEGRTIQTKRLSYTFLFKFLEYYIYQVGFFIYPDTANMQEVGAGMEESCGAEMGGRGENNVKRRSRMCKRRKERRRDRACEFAASCVYRGVCARRLTAALHDGVDQGTHDLPARSKKDKHKIQRSETRRKGRSSGVQSVGAAERCGAHTKNGDKNTRTENRTPVHTYVYIHISTYLGHRERYRR